MSQADELLMSLGEDIVQTATGNIVVGADRFITVPDSLKKIAVQYDHDIETVTFDCPRYWDGHDLSKMRIYINYMRPDGVLGSHICSNVVLEQSDNDIMHFDWTISGHVTYVSGTITFLVCVKSVDADGTEENIWHTEINSDMYVSTGMKCHETILRRYPDIITQLLYRMDQSEAIVEAARKAETGAKAAQESIESMTVSAETLGPDEAAAVEKTVVDDIVNLHFGLPRGNGISSIARTDGTGAAGTTDTYTITFTDGTTTTFGVYNGRDSDMLASVYDPQGKAQDVFAYVDALTAEDIGAGRVNPNLLHNWYFINPVNQRGNVGYGGEVNYTIDRWKSRSETLALQTYEGFVRLESTTSTSYLAQYLENAPAGTYTLTALVKSVSGTPSTSGNYGAIYISDGSTVSSAAYIKTAGLHSITVTMNKPLSSFQFQLTAGSIVDVIAAKLELGTQQTLAHQDAGGNWVLNEIPDYGEQLAICQRYFEIIEATKCIASSDIRINGVRFRVKKRTTPTVTFYPYKSGTPWYDTDMPGYVTNNNASENIAVDGTSVLSADGFANIVGPFIAGESYIVSAFVSADL